MLPYLNRKYRVLLILISRYLENTVRYWQEYRFFWEVIVGIEVAYANFDDSCIITIKIEMESSGK